MDNGCGSEEIRTPDYVICTVPTGSWHVFREHTKSDSPHVELGAPKGSAVLSIGDYTVPPEHGQSWCSLLRRCFVWRRHGYQGWRPLAFVRLTPIETC